MSTPIETNTEQLQEILRTVNNLPSVGGGGSFEIPVIDCIELGFPEINDETAGTDGMYQEFVPVDADTYQSVVSKMAAGIVSIRFSAYDGESVFVCLGESSISPGYSSFSVAHSNIYNALCLYAESYQDGTDIGYVLILEARMF